MVKRDTEQGETVASAPTTSCSTQRDEAHSETHLVEGDTVRP